MDNVKCTSGLYYGGVWNPQTYAMSMYSFLSDVWGHALYRKRKRLHQGFERLQLFGWQWHASCCVQYTWYHHRREDGHTALCGCRVDVKMAELLFDLM